MPTETTLPPRPSANTDSVSFRRRASDNGPDAPAAETVPPVAETGPPAESQDEVQRWTARRRTALVLSILKGEMTAEGVASRHGLAVAEVEDWKQRFLTAAQNALRSRPRDEDALRDEQIRRLKQKVGELVLEVDLLRDAARNPRTGAADEAEE